MSRLNTIIQTYDARGLPEFIFRLTRRYPFSNLSQYHKYERLLKGIELMRPIDE